MILIIDDDAGVRSSLAFLLKHSGYATESAAGPEEAIAVVRRTQPRLILLDMNFSLTTTGEEGLDLLRQLKVLHPRVPVILMTAWGSISLAVKGMQAGAFDFISKPWNNLMLLQSVNTALAISEQRNAPDKESEADEGRKKTQFKGIIGRSPALMNILDTVERIAPTNASVLITGESGTGKELIAEAIHAHSRRSRKPFVKVNLGGLSQTLFESEMFGHRKGAFTDAYMDRKGRFELADGGTIFLDEIGDLELGSQVKLLRVLQDMTYEALGDSHTRKVDVRVVSATNRNVREMVADRTFREDLFYRINLITIDLPPLRERREDIALLATHFASELVRRDGLDPMELTPDALTYLERLPYPGNVRELKNLVERTLLISGRRQVTASDFEALGGAVDERTTGHAPINASGLTLDDMERQAILSAIDLYKGNLSHVARSLGISRAALYRRLEKYNIPTDK